MKTKAAKSDREAMVSEKGPGIWLYSNIGKV